MNYCDRTPITAARGLGIFFGLATHAVFAVTVWRLVIFLHGLPDGVLAGTQTTNLFLAVAFAIPHSLLLHRAVRDRLTWVPAPFYGSFYTLVTCICLWGCFLFWRKQVFTLWQFEGLLAGVMEAGFIGSWIALLYSIRLTGFGWQTGLTPWLAWLRGRPHPRRNFDPRGAYRHFRHPVYLSFLGLLWFTPTMTGDRAILVATWTAYILVGSLLKDERLLYYLGDRYRAYQETVPGYPLVGFGPWGKRRRASIVAEGALAIISVGAINDTRTFVEPLRRAG